MFAARSSAFRVGADARDRFARDALDYARSGEVDDESIDVIEKVQTCDCQDELPDRIDDL